MLIPFLQEDEDKMKDVSLSFSADALEEASQYLYVGQLNDFFSINDNIVTFDIYGRNDYDKDEQQQAHYTLIVRKAGQYTNRLYIDYHQIMGISDGDASSLIQARAYYKADGTVKIYLSAATAVTYSSVSIEVKGKNLNFTSAMDYGATFSAPAGFTDWTTSGWLKIRKQVFSDDNFVKQRSIMVSIGSNTETGPKRSIFKYMDLFKTDFGTDNSKIILQVTPLIGETIPNIYTITIRNGSDAGFEIMTYRLDTPGTGWTHDLKAFITVTEVK